MKTIYATEDELGNSLLNTIELDIVLPTYVYCTRHKLSMSGAPCPFCIAGVRSLSGRNNP